MRTSALCGAAARYRLTTAGQSPDRDIRVLLYITVFVKDGMSFAGRINQDDYFFLKILNATGALPSLEFLGRPQF